MTAEVEPYVCDLAEARALTDKIKTAAEQVWNLLLQAHTQRAWAALGYDRWEDYVRAEFDLSRSHSYYLLDQARVIRAIQNVVPVSTKVDISERQARAIKPVLPDVVDAVDHRMAGIRAKQRAEPAQDEINQAVAEEIERARLLARDKAAADKAEREAQAEREAEAAARRTNDKHRDSAPIQDQLNDGVKVSPDAQYLDQAWRKFKKARADLLSLDAKVLARSVPDDALASYVSDLAADLSSFVGELHSLTSPRRALRSVENS